MKLKGSMLTPRGSTSERFQYRKIPWILTILTWRRAWRTTLRSCARTAEWRRRKNWRPVPKRSEISNHSVVQQSEIKCRGSMQRIRQPTIQPLRSSVCLIAALFVLTVAHRSDAQQREKVRVALGSISVNTSVIPVGHQYGMSAKYGVDLEPIYMGGGMNSLAAVTSNTVQFLSAGSTATISAHLGGIDIVMLTVQSNKLDYSVYAAPEIKSPQDLKGKIVTGTRPGASDSALRLYLRRAGLVPDKDVIFISVGDSQQGRLNALHRGSVSATVLAPPYSGMAKQFGLRELADLRKSDIEYAGSSIAGMGSYIKSQPQLVENFLKGYIESLYFFRTQKERTLAGVMKFLKMNDRARAEE